MLTTLKHGGFKKYFVNTNWLLLGQLVSLLMSFFVGTWIGKYLGPDGYGEMNYITSFVGLFSFIAVFGLESVIIKLLLERKEHTDKILGTGAFIRLFTGILAILAILLVSLFTESSGNYRILMFIFSLHLILQTTQIITYFFQAQVLAKQNTIALLSATVITTILKIICILWDAPLSVFIGVLALDSVWQALFLIIIYIRSGYTFKTWKYSSVLAREILQRSWFLMFASAATLVLLRIDQIMLKHWLGEQALGIYAAAVKFVEIWYFIPAVLVASLFPALVNARLVSKQIFRRRISYLLLLLGAICLVIILCTILFAKIAVLRLFGDAYLEAVPILKLYAWSSFGFFLSYSLNQYFIAENKHWMVLLLSIFSMIINVSLNVLLIPRFGLYGAVYATLISYLVAPIGMLIYEFFTWRGEHSQSRES